MHRYGSGDTLKVVKMYKIHHHFTPFYAMNSGTLMMWFSGVLDEITNPRDWQRKYNGLPDIAVTLKGTG
jgi:hypothetical protein